MTVATDKDTRDGLLAEEEIALRDNSELYLDCLNGKLLRDRKTPDEIRQGLILFHHIYKVCKP